MLSLHLNDQPLDIDPDTAVNITLHNPAFDEAGVARIYNFPVKLPLTPHNVALMDHLHRIDSRARASTMPQDIRLGGILWARGVVGFSEVTDKLAEAVFRNRDFDVLAKLQDIKLRELMPVIPIPQTQRTRYVLTPGGGPNWLITINDVLYTAGGLGVAKPDAMNDLVADINAVYPLAASYNPGTDEFILSTLADPFVISFSVTSFTLVSEQTLSDAREKNIQAYITAASAGTAPVAFPMIYAPQFYGSRAFAWRFFINHMIDGDFLTNGYGIEYGWDTTYVPFVRLRYALDAIATAAGLDAILFDIDAETANDLNDLLIWNNVTLDNVRLEAGVTEDSTGEKNGFLTEINLANHVPDYTAAELIERIRKFFNLHLRYEQNTLYLRKNRDQSSAAPVDWSAISSPAYKRTTAQGSGVTLSFDDTTPAKAFPEHDPYIVGAGENSLVLPARPLHDRILPVFEVANKRILCAAIEDYQGTSEPLDLENEDLTLRLFFDQGIQFGEDDIEYWMASVGTEDYHGDPIGVLSLAFDGEYGLYPNFWQGWTQYLFSPTITRVTALSLAQLLDLQDWRLPLVYIYSPHGAALSIVERVQVKVSTQGIAQASVEYRKFEP